MARLWLDAHDYGARLLRAGDEPWDDPAGLGPFCGEVAGLLAPWRLAVPLEPILLPKLTDSGDAAARAEALDALVDSIPFERTLEIGLRTMAQCRAASICVPRLPGPSRIIGVSCDEDALDDAVAALGRILRQVVAVGMAGGVVLHEPDPAARELCGPLHRIAEHAGVELQTIGVSLAAVEWQAVGSLPRDAEGITVVPRDAPAEAVLTTLERMGMAR